MDSDQGKGKQGLEPDAPLDQQQEIDMQRREYQMMVQQAKPKPAVAQNAVAAFVVGGLICAIGQLFTNYFLSTGMSVKEAGSATAGTMIFLGAFFTGLGIYDHLGKFGGAGSIVPITGFANSIVSAAMEWKREGYIFGVGAKLFTIAGPVLVYGFLTSVLIGLLYYVMQ